MKNGAISPADSEKQVHSIYSRQRSVNIDNATDWNTDLYLFIVKGFVGIDYKGFASLDR